MDLAVAGGIRNHAALRLAQEMTFFNKAVAASMRRSGRLGFLATFDGKESILRNGHFLFGGRGQPVDALSSHKNEMA